MVIRFTDIHLNQYEIDVSKVSNIYHKDDYMIIVTTDGTEYTAVHTVKFNSVWC